MERYVFAVGSDQAGIFVDVIAVLVARTPGLAGAVDVNSRTATVKSTGASLSFESSDGASAFGLRPWLIVADELALWPSTANHRRLWSAIVSALSKVPGSRLVVATTAGSPVALGAKVWAEAETSPFWRAVRRSGPSPWWTDEDIEALTVSLSQAEYARLIAQVELAEGDDTLKSADDVAAAIRAGVTLIPPGRGAEYVAALVVGHVARREQGRVVVVHRALYWHPCDGKMGRVDLAKVEAATLAVCGEYRVTRLRFDRMQAE